MAASHTACFINYLDARPPGIYVDVDNTCKCNIETVFRFLNAKSSRETAFLRQMSNFNTVSPTEPPEWGAEVDP